MRINPYEKLRLAHKQNRGTRLTPEDVDKLMADTAIYDAVMATYDDEDNEMDERELKGGERDE